MVVPNGYFCLNTIDLTTPEIFSTFYVDICWQYIIMLFFSLTKTHLCGCLVIVFGNLEEEGVERYFEVISSECHFDN